METIIQNFNNAIGWSILHSIWQGACFYLILLGLFIIYPRMNSSIKYVIALLSEVSLFLSFLYTFYLYINFEAIHKTNIELNQQQELILYINYLKTKSWSITQMFPYLVSFYAIGVFIQIILSLKSIQTLKWIRKNGSEYVPLVWQDNFVKIINQHKNRGKISLKVSDLITVPITIGFFKPIIIIPTAYINNISEEEAEAILLHEFAHIKRHDYLFNIILISIETILFFNPFVWLISKHIKMERELACDDFASKQSKSPHIYASALLKVEILRKENASIFAMAATGSKNYKLLDRIKRINNKNMETKYTSIKYQISAVLLASIALISVAWISPEYAKQSKTHKSNDLSPINRNISKNEKFDVIKDDTINTRQANKNVKPLIIHDTTVFLNKNTETKERHDVTKKVELGEKKFQIYFESPKWKDKIALIEENARRIEEKYNSSEFKQRMALVEENARKIEEKYNSPEFKQRIALIEENARRIEEKYSKEVQELKQQKEIQ